VCVVTLVAIAVGLAFGAQQTYFTIETSHVFGKDVDPDLKLAFLGFFNKSLDVLVLSSAEYTVLMLVTVWMISLKSAKSRDGGATVHDFELKDELTKP